MSTFECKRHGDERYEEFERALTDVLIEREYFLERRTRLARARAAVHKRDPRYWESDMNHIVNDASPQKNYQLEKTKSSAQAELSLHHFWCKVQQ